MPAAVAGVIAGNRIIEQDQNNKIEKDVGENTCIGENKTQNNIGNNTNIGEFK